MRRREFIAGLGATASATLWPRAPLAQQPAAPIVGFLSSHSAWESGYLAAAFRRGLEEMGYAEGRNVFVEYRWAEGHYERLPMLASDLVRRPVAVIAASGGVVVARTAREMTQTIPIVFQTGADPVAAGLVISLNRPGGNLTGVTGLGAALGPKRLQLLKELSPAATNFGFLVNPKNPSAEADIKAAGEAAGELGVGLHILHASNESELTAAFAASSKLRLGGLALSPDGFFGSQSEQLATLTLRYAVPAIYQYRVFAVSGGLISYGSSDTDLLRQVGVYVGRIFKGEKATDLPVQQSTKIELIVNLKTAKALGLTFPITLLGRADEVIE